jgi:hypothetical protein
MTVRRPTKAARSRIAGQRARASTNIATGAGATLPICIEQEKSTQARPPGDDDAAAKAADAWGR